MAGTTFLSTPSQLSSPSTGAWTDWDVSSLVSDAAVGVIVRFHHNAATSGNHEIGLRENGSTDDFPGTLDCDIDDNCLVELYCGLDGSGIIEYYIQNSSLDLWLVGYFEAETTFFTNAVDKSTGTTGSYVDVDISSDTGGDTAIAALFQSPGNEFRFLYLRNNGSTDTVGTTKDIGMQSWAVGVDGSEICEQYAASTQRDLYLVGYYTSDSVWVTNRNLYNITSANTYQTFVPHADATGVFAETDAETAVSGNYALRHPDDATWADRGKGNMHLSHWSCGCNASGEFEAISDGTSRDWYGMGYVTEPVAAGRLMSSLADAGGLAARGGLAGLGGGLAG